LSTIDIQKVVNDLAEYMQNRDALTGAYAIVCNPARKYDIMSIIEGEADKQPLTHLQIVRQFAKPIDTHEWCPVETIYLPQSKEQYDKLMTDLDQYGAKMRGEVCIQPECSEPTVETWGTGNHKMGLCLKHKEAVERWADSNGRLYIEKFDPKS
jgi:hypothetical protein